MPTPLQTPLQTPPQAPLRQADGTIRRLWFAGVCGSVLLGAITALGLFAFPGRTGALVVKACFVMSIAFTLCLAYSGKHVGDELYAISRDGNNTQSRLVAIALGAAALGIIAALALGAIPSLSDNARFVVGVAGFVVSACAIVAWLKWIDRQINRQDTARPIASGKAVLATSVAAGALAAAGLGLGLGIRISPVDNIGVYSLATGAIVAITTAYLNWWHLHTPKLAVQFGALHQQLESTTTEKADAQQKLHDMEESYDSLMARHQTELERKKQLVNEIETLREGLAPAPTNQLSDACAAVAEAHGLSKRESDVLLCLARGWSRKRIAEELYVEPSTVSSHIARIYRKLGVHSSQELIDYVGSCR